MLVNCTLDGACDEVVSSPPHHLTPLSAHHPFPPQTGLLTHPGEAVDGDGA